MAILLDAVSEVFPLLFRDGEVGAEVQHHPLSRPPLGPYRFDEFERMVYSGVLFVRMEDLPYEHTEYYRVVPGKSILSYHLLVLQLPF